MIEKRDCHTHTRYSDGDNTPEEMILRAISAGMEEICITDHAYTSFDTRYCIAREKLDAYRLEVTSLKEKYADKIRVLVGIEQDFYSDLPAKGYDRVIGSVHYLRAGDEYIPVDDAAKILRDAARRYFGGDMYALAECYFDTVARVAEKTGCDVIGHFDLISKFQEREPLFDESHPRYRAAWKKAVDALLPYGIPFEVNYGAVTRGYRTSPYPSDEIRAYIRARGGSFVFSSDSHSTATLGIPHTPNT